jgi:hypothetical protein
MLRYSTIKAADLSKVVPALSELDSHILARVDIDGNTTPSYTPHH